MKKEKKLKKFGLRIGIAGSIFTILGVLVTISKLNEEKNTVDSHTVSITGDGNEVNLDSTIQNFNIDNSSQQTINQTNTYMGNINTTDYNFANKTEEELLMMAQYACSVQEFDYAYDVYNSEQLSDNQLALLNKGYILANDLSYVGKNIEKAVACYEKSDCIEAKRNLFALYLEEAEIEKACELLDALLWTENDEATWDYISLCLYDELWKDYSEKQGIDKGTFSLDLYELYEWENTYEFKEGFRGDVPEDSISEQWVLMGPITSEKSVSPVMRYQLQIAKFAKQKKFYEAMYYFTDDGYEAFHFNKEDDH